MLRIKIREMNANSQNTKMEIKNLTQESWTNDIKRSKIKVDDKIIYYICNNEDNKLLKWEIDIMKLGREYGINSPEILYYEENGHVEICIMEFIKGRKTNKGDLELINRELEKFNHTPARNKTTLKNNIVFPDGSADNLSTKELEELIRSRVCKLCDYWEIEKPKFPDTEITGPCVFSYGDITHDNMVYKEGKIFFIDWECSGFFPKGLVNSLCNQEIEEHKELEGWNSIINILKHLQINKDHAKALISSHNAK